MSAATRRSIGLSVLMAMLALLAVTATADAATYTVFSCRGPDGKAVSTRAWQADEDDNGVSDGCSDGGALSASLDVGGREGQQLSGWRFMAPPDTVIAGYRMQLTATTAAIQGLQAGLATGSLLGSPDVTQGCPDADCSFGDVEDPLSEENLVTSGGLANPALALVAGCRGYFGCFFEGTFDGVAATQLWRSAVDVLDEDPPQLGKPSGSLLGPGAASGRAAIGATATDTGGGIRAVALRIDGTEVARTSAGGDCAEPYVVAQPCPDTLPANFEVDTRGLTDGDHVAELRAFDAAGQTTSTGLLPFSSSNTTTGGGGGGGAGGGGAGGGGSGGGGGGAGGGGTTVTVPVDPISVRIDLARTRFTLPAPGGTLKGVVKRADGTPAAGVPLEVRSARFGTGEPKYRTERTLRSDASGAFAVPLGTTSRRMFVRVEDPAYRSAESSEVRILEQLRVSLRARGKNLRNGSTMTLLARISGAGPGAADERTVLVQAMVGRRWATVGSAEANALGHASWRYRFRGTTRAARYQFRVRVPHGGADWPFALATSPVVAVNVNP